MMKAMHCWNTNVSPKPAKKHFEGTLLVSFLAVTEELEEISVRN
jgi:hypothetical protein